MCNILWRTTWFLLILVGAVPAGGVLADSATSDVIVLEQPLRFLGSEGSALLVEPGVYRVFPLVGSRLQLIAEGSLPVFLDVEVFLHEEALELPQAALLSDDENPDIKHVVLLLPDGQALEATASTTGLIARGVKKPWKQRRAGIQQMMLSRRQQQTGPLPKPTKKSLPHSPGGLATSPERVTPENQGKLVGMVTWGYLRMHHPDMVLEELKQVQAGKQDVSSLAGLAGERSLKRLLSTDLSKISLPQASSKKVVSRGLFGKIGGTRNQVGSGVISGLKNSPTSAPTSSPPVTLSPGLGLDRLGKEISPSTPPTILPPNVLKVPSSPKDTQRDAPKAKDAWTALLAGPHTISPERYVVYPVDYFPNMLNLGHVWDQQISTATLHLVAPSEGTVMASMPEGTPFRVVEIKTYSGKVMPSSGNSPIQATKRVTRRPDFPEATLIASPFRLPVKAGQDVTVTVEFAPKFNLFKQAAGDKRTTLHVEGHRWSADVPVTGFFEGLPIGVIAQLESPYSTTDNVVFLEKMVCSHGTMAFPVWLILINSDPVPHTVTVSSRVLGGGTNYVVTPTTIALGPRETKRQQVEAFISPCTYSEQRQEFDAAITYQFDSLSSSVPSSRVIPMKFSLFPGTFHWAYEESEGSCDFKYYFHIDLNNRKSTLSVSVKNANHVFAARFGVSVFLPAFHNVLAATWNQRLSPRGYESIWSKEFPIPDSVRNDPTRLYGSPVRYGTWCDLTGDPLDAPSLLLP